MTITKNNEYIGIDISKDTLDVAAATAMNTGI